MRKSWTRFLPPISPDYSGACSCLYELDPLIIIHDAAGCTGNYTGYDEPRWYDRPAPVFCSNLRELDAVLGRDDRLIRGIEDCLDAIRPKVILICGSPVPAVIGTDFEGIATEVESLTKIPTIGLATNGAHLYNQGYARCLEALVRRFLRTGPKTEPDGNRGATVSLFGLSAIDGMDRSYVDWIRRGLNQAGVESICSVTIGCGLSELERLRRTDRIWVFSEAGEGAAELVRRYNPSVRVLRGLPLTDASRDRMIRRLLADGGADETRAPEKARETGAAETGRKALIVAEPYLAASIADLLNEAADGWTVDTVVLQEDLGFSSHGRVDHVESEEALRARFAASDAAFIIADPLLKRFSSPDAEFIAWPQFSLSSHFYGADERSVRDQAGQFLEELRRMFSSGRIPGLSD